MEGLTKDKSISKSSAYSVTLVAMFAALTVICSQISIPIGPVPINLALFAVFSSGGILGIGRATASQALYVLMGLVGLPVFAGFKGGAGVLAGPTGGYIVGYIVAAFLIALIISKTGKKAAPVALAMIAGLVACYALGTIWYMISANVGFLAAFGSCVAPFLLGDAAKIALAVFITIRLKNAIK